LHCKVHSTKERSIEGFIDPAGRNMSAKQEYTSIQMLEQLVSFDTESDKSNLTLIGFVEDYLTAWDVPSVRFPNSDGTKTALVATIGPMRDGGVVLSGHTDVVPVAGQVWTGDPFKLRIMDGKAYGRGTVDMKGFLALGLSLVPQMIAAQLQSPIHLFLSYDEETTCLGVIDGIAAFGKTLPRPRAVFVGEPTDMEIADAHKSVVTYKTVVTGFEAHSSKPELGANAIEGAARLVVFLADLHEEMVARGDASGRFDPPYVTIHTGLLNGGNARNILARNCTFDWEFRGLPDLDRTEIPTRFAKASDAVLTRMRRTAPTAQIETTMGVAVPGLRPDPGSVAETLAMRLAGRNATVTVPYGSEAGHFQNAGLATIVCGPGSINQAHQPDEYITLDALQAGKAFISNLIKEQQPR
jgi:acetylornithine deacetylase